MKKMRLFLTITVLLLACSIFSPQAQETPPLQEQESPAMQEQEPPAPQIIYRSPGEMNLQPQDVPDLTEVAIEYPAEGPLLPDTIDQDQRAYINPNKNIYIESYAIMLLDIPKKNPRQIVEEVLFNRHPNTKVIFDETTAQDEGETPILVEEETSEPDFPPPVENLLRQWAQHAGASSEYSNPSWAAFQAAGEPDTFECGDISTAWASRGVSSVEWIDLFYETPVIPTEINIYQTYNPGYITEVNLFDNENNTHVVYTAQPSPETTCPSVLSIPIEGDVETFHIRVIIDQTTLNDWAEIDAVELVGYLGSHPPQPDVEPPAAGPSLGELTEPTTPITDICQSCSMFRIIENCSSDHQTGLTLFIQHENMVIIMIGCGTDVTEKTMIDYGVIACRHITAPVLSTSEPPAATATREEVSTPTIPPTETPEVLSPQTTTGSISGKLSFPSEGIPPQRIVAISITTGDYYTMDTDFDDRYQFHGLPAGTYHVYAFSLDTLGFVAGLAAGYTEAVPCGLTYTCSDHTPIDVIVSANQEAKGIDIMDWFIPPELLPKLPCDPAINYTYDTGTCLPLESKID